ncbi:rhodanese-like domain-containing protein [Viridibacillus arvi]|uniref:MBL fold metallo-hydrolase n=1 Tax=Viridibacillus arvi TaxID=263475 RepID=UPI0036B9904F
MFFQSFFDDKLAQYSYLIGCQRTGESIVIDPSRHYKNILAVAKKQGLTITAAAETHIHADFISGSRQLANDLQVKLFLSDEGDVDWKYHYTNNLNVELVKDGSKFSIGNVDFEVIHTPGHTPESISFILTDRGGGATSPMGIFTGDFVFVGDVGRPDLLEKAVGVKNSAGIGARQMFDSLKRFKELPDYLMVWPSHGAGSACGKSLGAIPSSTVGYEKMFNWALNIDDEDLFVKELLKDQPEAPTYFSEMKKANKMGPTILKEKTSEYITSSTDIEELLSNKQVIIIDTRDANIAEKSLLPGSINIPFNKSFVNWAGWLIKYDEDIVLVAETAQLHEIIKALQSIHLDDVKGIILPENIESFEKVSYDTIDVEQFKNEASDQYIMDIRNNSEWKNGHIENANHHFLGHLRTTTLDREMPIYLHCQSGVRSAIGASVLKSLGFKKIKHLAGGYNAYQKEEIKK